MAILLGDFIKIEESKWQPNHIQYDTENYPKPPYEDLVFVEKIEPEVIEGKYSIMYYNPKINSMFYEYFDRPITPEEELTQARQEIEELKSQNSQMLFALMVGGLM